MQFDLTTQKRTAEGNRPPKSTEMESTAQQKHPAPVAGYTPRRYHGSPSAGRAATEAKRTTHAASGRRIAGDPAKAETIRTGDYAAVNCYRNGTPANATSEYTNDEPLYYDSEDTNEEMPDWISESDSCCSDSEEEKHENTETCCVHINDDEVRQTEKVAEETSAEDLLQGMNIIPKVQSDSPAWDAQVEGCIQQLACGLRDSPTVPPDPCDPTQPWYDTDDGTLWPAKHCAFSGCAWHGTTESDLEKHLETSHQHNFNCAEQWLDMEDVHGFKPVKHFSNKSWMGLYNAAIAYKERNGVPSVGCCVDRRAHEAFTCRQSGRKLCAPICFCCARVLPYDEDDAQRTLNEETCQEADIQWRKVFKQNKFCNMSRAQTMQTLGMESYIDDYGNREKGPNLKSVDAQHDLRQWDLTIPFTDGPVKVLCCPEDRKCTADSTWSDGNRYAVPESHEICENCELPVCKECWKTLSKSHKRPHMSLANDLWTGYIPKIIYEKNCTYMELLAASVCSPTLMSIQYEFYKQYVDKNKENVHMQQHRTGARGNFTGTQERPTLLTHE